MKKIIIILISVISMHLNAQDEVLMPLGANINLYYQTQNFQNVAKNEIIPNNVVLLTDSLPFIDDFSSNTLQKLGEPQYDVTKSILFATGSCVINDDFDFEKKAFHNSPTYTYTYNLITTQVDSVESLDTIKIYTFSNSECFPIETSIANYWEPYYRSDVSDFNTVTGEKLDSTLVMPTDSINIATVQIARNNNNWNDNYAWWNTTNPIEPITIGVATLDGLNEFGLPYNNSVTNAYGIADYLTSKQIDLSGLGLNDDVYLSFFYQAGGMGDNPNPQDSLIVEIKGADGVWKRKWSSEGMASSDFKQAYVKIYETNFDSLIYSNNEFQFRFKNYASLSGNNDWWNIDYVRLGIKGGINIGLIVNEAVNNAIEHAYGGGVEEIDVTLKCHKLECVLTIKDNGIGFNTEKEFQSLGMTLIEDLSASLPQGRIEINVHNGTKIEIYFNITQEI